MESPHDRSARGGGRAGPPKLRPVVPLVGAAALAGLVALSVPSIGKSAPPTAPVEIGVDAALSEGRPFLTLPWGSGPAQVGLVRPAEGLARGPEAFAIAPDGRVAILDSVNRRLLLAGGQDGTIASAALDLGDPRFIAASDEAVFLLEENEGRLLGFDWAGKPTAELAISRFEEPVTGLFLRKERLFVELLHDQVYELRLKGRGSAVTVRVNGRPADPAGYRQAQASFSRGRPAKIRTVEPGAEAQEQELTFPQPIEHLLSLDADGAGRLALGARLLQDPNAPPAEPEILVSQVPSPDERAGAILLDEGEPFAFLGEPYRYGPDGRVYQPMADEDGFTILVHELPAGPR